MAVHQRIREHDSTKEPIFEESNKKMDLETEASGKASIIKDVDSKTKEEIFEERGMDTEVKMAEMVDEETPMEMI